jgi:tryptophan synthase alpha chain
VTGLGAVHRVGAMSTGTDRIAQAFQRGPAFMPYVMGGYPTVRRSAEIGVQIAEAGADIVELGIPFSDPLADGPVIHAASTRALRAGVTVDGVLGVCEQVSAIVPTVVMTYANIVMARGIAEFVRSLRDAGASGLIVPDLPLEESRETVSACEAAGLAFVPLVAPTTTDERMAEIGRLASGFLYAVSVVGTTGERSQTEAYADVIGRAKRNTDVPVALGFGISSPEQAAAAVAAGADGVISASRLIRAIGADEDFVGLTRAMAAAVHGDAS